MTRSENTVAERPSNVLITSASRKVLLVRAFQEAAAALGGGRVLAADVDPAAAALYEADGAHLVPTSDDPAFISTLLRLCRDEAIALVVPTRDGELLVLARHREQFATQGTLVLVSPPEALAICQDKARFVEVVAGLGYRTPRTWSSPAVARLPAFVKPRFGQGGHGARLVRTPEELWASVTLLGDDVVIQELMQAPEFTVDAFLDLEGRPISCVPRLRIAVVAGESVVSRTVDDPGLVQDSLGLASALGLVGHVTIQAFRESGRTTFIEVNPRYGGAANLGFAAGARTPEYAIQLARGERLEPRVGDYRSDLLMLRHAEDRFLPASSLIPYDRP